MKKIFTILIAVLLSASMFAQTPEKMSYQAVVRDADDNLVTSSEVGIQISILQGSNNGTPVYVEIQTPTSNANGLVSFEIGGDNATVVSGDFSTINWVNSTYFIKTETDPTGGTSYTITGTSQLLSVPYALHAKTAESVDNINITGNETTFNGWDKNEADDFDGQYSSLTGAPANVSDFTNDAGYITVFSEVDGSVTNEIQDLQLAGNNLTITNNGTATTIDLSTYLDNTDTQLTEAQVDAYAGNNGYLETEVDGSISNEIQDLQLVGNNLTITNNGTATTIDLTPYLDNTDTQLTEVEVDAYVDNNGYLKTEVDGSVSNEIQDLQLTGNNLTITNNGTATTIDLSPYLDNTDTQLTEAQVDTYADNNGYLETEVDGDITNEIQNLADVIAVSNLANAQIKNVTDPVDDQDAATKAYVDALKQQIEAIQNSMIAAGLMARDYDGNIYGAVTIGTQIWMKENLKTTHYANGDEILDGTGVGAISTTDDSQYWFAYNDDLNNVSTYGRLYNWYTVTDSRNVCPDGWHVPTNDEWSTLMDYLGGESVAGAKLKETGTEHWTAPNSDATNETGFTALPGGRCYSGSSTNRWWGINSDGLWWSTTEDEDEARFGKFWSIPAYNSSFYEGRNTKEQGFSVRCLKD